MVESSSDVELISVPVGHTVRIGQGLAVLAGLILTRIAPVKVGVLELFRKMILTKHTLWPSFENSVTQGLVVMVVWGAGCGD